MGKTHYLDLNTLLSYLRNRTGRLTTTFQTAGRSYKGSITFVRGQIMACFVEWSDGHLEGNAALNVLQSRKEWQVHYDDVAQLSPSPQQPPPGASSEAAPIPHPTAYPLSAELLNGYTTQQRFILRTVYALIDGHHSIAQIKAQLNLPPETIDTALDVLRKLGTIQ